MSKKTKKATYTLAFLDVLSNAMAAVLIIAMVKMQPDTRGLEEPGLYSITVENKTTPLEPNIGLAIQYKDAPYIFSNEKNNHQEVQLFTPSTGPARILFFGKPKVAKIENIICFIQDPDPMQNIETEIIVRLPNSKKPYKIWLNENNDFLHYIKRDTLK